MDAIAKSTRDAREKGWTGKDDQGHSVNGVRNIGTLGGATLDNEGNYLIDAMCKFLVQCLGV